MGKIGTFSRIVGTFPNKVGPCGLKVGNHRPRFAVAREEWLSKIRKRFEPTTILVFPPDSKF